MASPPQSRPLGELEAAILMTLWSSSAKLSVREVLGRIKRRPALAYTTVMTVLDRLYSKGLVAREKKGKAFLYWPCMSKESWLGVSAARVLTQADSPPDRAVLMAFLDSAEEADPGLIARLSDLIEQRRGDDSE
jgi:predicted transcriptional regulator